VLLTRRNGEIAGNDPWDGHTLEWATTSPPPPHNFDALPIVRSRRPVWDLKYGGTIEPGDLTKPRDAKAAGSSEEDPQPHSIHLPPPSFYPLVVAFGLTAAAYGLLYESIIGIVIGMSIMCTGIAGLASQAAKD
jgi:hypothetical protein